MFDFLKPILNLGIIFFVISAKDFAPYEFIFAQEEI